MSVGVFVGFLVFFGRWVLWTFGILVPGVFDVGSSVCWCVRFISECWFICVAVCFFVGCRFICLFVHLLVCAVVGLIGWWCVRLFERLLVYSFGGLSVQ